MDTSKETELKEPEYSPDVYELIFWVDSTSQPGWGEYKEKEHDMMCKTVGMFHKEDGISVVLAMNWSPHNSGEYMRIPKCSIISRTILEAVRNG